MAALTLLSNAIDVLLQQMECPVNSTTFGAPSDPGSNAVILKCHHIFSESYIKTLTSNSNAACPLCRELIESAQLFPFASGNGSLALKVKAAFDEHAKDQAKANADKEKRIGELEQELLNAKAKLRNEKTAPAESPNKKMRIEKEEKLEKRDKDLLPESFGTFVIPRPKKISNDRESIKDFIMKNENPAASLCEIEMQCYFRKYFILYLKYLEEVDVDINSMRDYLNKNEIHFKVEKKNVLSLNSKDSPQRIMEVFNLIKERSSLPENGICFFECRNPVQKSSEYTQTTSKFGNLTRSRREFEPGIAGVEAAQLE